jgi:hypothetical protein
MRCLHLQGDVMRDSQHVHLKLLCQPTNLHGVKPQKACHLLSAVASNEKVIFYYEVYF